MSDPRRPLRDRLRDEAQRLGVPLDARAVAAILPGKCAVRGVAY